MMTLTPTVTNLGLRLGETSPIAIRKLTALGWYYYPLGYMNPAPYTVTLFPGDRLKITLSFQYTGPAVTGVSAKYAIGIYSAYGFDEKVYVTTTFNIPANSSTTPITITSDAVLTLPTSGVTADWNDIYVKMWGGSPSIGGTESSPNYIFGYENALAIGNLPPTMPTITQFTILGFVKV
jgi:hypothetical protein